MPKKLCSELLWVTDGAVGSSGGDVDLSLFRVFTVDLYQEISSAQLSLPFSTRPHGCSLLFEATEGKHLLSLQIQGVGLYGSKELVHPYRYLRLNGS